MRFLRLSLLSLFLLRLAVANTQSTAPTIGIPTFESAVEIDDGSLLLLGEAAERGLSGQEGFRLVDRRRMDAVFFAREEVRHEDYLASDRDQIAALGADYILLGKVQRRDLRLRYGFDNFAPSFAMVFCPSRSVTVTLPPAFLPSSYVPFR